MKIKTFCQGSVLKLSFPDNYMNRIYLIEPNN